MAPTLHQEIGLRREGSAAEVSEPAVQPERLDSPFSAALPRTVAGRQRTLPTVTAWPQVSLPRKWRLDWAGFGVMGLMTASAVLAVYRLLWAIH